MSQPVIRAEGVSKRYEIGALGRGYRTFQEAVTEAFRAPLRGLRGQGERPETFWALQDVDFEVQRGEVMGIIGRNGAGKSTMLRILSRITEPTTGRVEIRGRVASLLEVGTGFHPELTGRENIFLNGAILGMARAEIQRKFDEIVAFAEVEKFLDTPVKRYSSGMYLKLAFAVAAHLEPDILLVDEVLAVGDMAFQKKCLGKIGEVASEGKTILFVSHNMPAVMAICNSGICFHKGRIALRGSSHDVVDFYATGGWISDGERRWDDPVDAPGNDQVRLLSAALVDDSGMVRSRMESREPFSIRLRYAVLQPLPMLRVCVRLHISYGPAVLQTGDIANPEWSDRKRAPGIYESVCRIPAHLLNDGQFNVSLSADIPYVAQLFQEDGVLSFEVVGSGSNAGRLLEPWPGVVCPSLEWTVKRLSEATDVVSSSAVSGQRSAVRV